MSSAQSNRIPVGQVLAGRYTITGFLGEGGFAAVYEGKDRVLEREVAIKVLNLQEIARTPQERASFTERFEREAKMAARIDHPNVVSVHDFSIFEGKPFIVMERLRGHDLDDEIKHHGPMKPARLWPLFCRGLDALGRGHAMEIVHKDLKPANIFLVHPGTEQEDVRVLDFGIARMMGDDAALTGTGQVFGTARYLSPEYIRDKNNVSPALDVYQMGLILVELLSGTPAVPADDGLACVHRHITGDLQIPGALMDSPLGPVVTRALALDPANRYPTTVAFRKALEQIDPASVPYLAPNSPRASLNQISASQRAISTPPHAPNTNEHILRPLTEVHPDSARTISDRIPALARGAAAQGATPLPGPGDPSISHTDKTRSLRPPPVMAAPAPTPQAPPSTPEGGRSKVVPWLALAGGAGVFVLLALIVGGVAIKALMSTDDPADPVPSAVNAAIPDSKDGEALIAPAESDDPDPAARALADDKIAGEDKAEGADEIVEAEGDKGAGEGDAAKPPAEEEAPAQAQIEVRLITDPPGATVKEGKKTLGETPLALTFAADDKTPRKLTLRRRGYQGQSVEISPGDAPDKTLSLQKWSPKASGGGGGGGGGLIPQ